MKVLDNIKFIKQIENGCCPASINIALDYYDERISLNQDECLRQLSSIGSSFFKATEKLFNSDTRYNTTYNFEELNTQSKEDWESKVKSYIDDNIPVIISTHSFKEDGSDNYHITVIYGYAGAKLYEMCPTNGSNLISLSDKLVNYGYGGTDLLIITKNEV